MFDRIEKGLYWDRALTLVSGCTPCSPGCDHCRSAALTHRFQRQSEHETFLTGTAPLTDSLQRFTGRIIIHPERLDIPLRRKKPTVWAIWNDLFHEDVSEEPFIREAFWNMGQAGWHIFLLFTKRAKRMAEWAQGKLWPENVWPGVTVCNQPEADEKIPLLLQIPAAVHFISYEPALGEILIKWWLDGNHESGRKPGWLICGGETGPGARPMRPEWAISVRDQCRASGVPFFFKQWGEWIPCSYLPGLKKPGIIMSIDGTPEGQVCRIGKKATGRLLDGLEYNELPEVKRCP